MPEGDTVWLAARSLDRALSDQVLTKCDLRVPHLATTDLSGLPVHRTLARGKHLLTRIGDHTLHTHLAMEGWWQVGRPGDRWRRPAHLARVVLSTAVAQAVGFELATVELLPTVREDEALGHLGPDLLGPDWDLEEAVRRLARDPDRNLGVALLDQTNLAGIGNVYRNELLFLFGLGPRARVADAKDLARVVTRAQQLLHANRARHARTTTGDLRPGRRTWVYGRARGCCRRCGTPLRSGEIEERPVVWCPSCQPSQ